LRAITWEIQTLCTHYFPTQGFSASVIQLKMCVASDQFTETSEGSRVTFQPQLYFCLALVELLNRLKQCTNGSRKIGRCAE